MKKLGILLGAALLAAACAGDDANQTPPSAIKGAPGDKAATSSFRAANIAINQVNQAVAAAAGGSPGAAIPNVQPEATRRDAVPAAPYAPQAAASTATGFEGPVAGPDATEGWYTQTFTFTDYAGKDAAFEVYIKSEPAQNLAAAWPKQIKSLKYAWRGVSGLYDGYQWDSELTVYDESRIGGQWRFRVVEPADAASYAKYYVGSEYSGEFDLGGEALGGDDVMDNEFSGNSVKIVYDYTNFSKYALHFVNGYDWRNQTVPTTPIVSDWFGAWSWSASANQVMTFDESAWTTTGGFSYDTLWYWGMGKGGDFTAEPAYAETVTPPASLWADPNADTSKGPAEGLYYWSKGAVKAEPDYKSVYGFGATEPTVTGTCSGQATSLTYKGGKKCVKVVDSCVNVWEGLFPVCSGN